MVISKFDKIYDSIKDGKTILGVGPMSKNCIDAVVELANERKIPLLLIGSRRQIEASSLGSGYVWDTKSLSEYVKSKDVGNYVFLARDHGGPWQGTDENSLSYEEAMTNALVSYKCDIESGFDIIHLDPSLKPRSYDEILLDVMTLYRKCEEYANDFGADIIFEAGTEEHGGHITSPDQFKDFVTKVKADCPKIKFVVGNMGLFIKEARNVGSFDEEQAKTLVSICNENDVLLKGHNTDYIDLKTFARHPTLGVHSVNMAPSFGVTETKTLLNLLSPTDRAKFIEIAYNSNKWYKWMIDFDQSIEYKATIAGHYVFSNPEVQEMMLPFNENLKDAVKNDILQHLIALGW